MMTFVAGWWLVLVMTGQPVVDRPFQHEEQCVDASWVYAFRTGQEVQCLPRYQVRLMP